MSSEDSQQELNAALIAACKQNDIAEAHRLLVAGADVHALDPTVPENRFSQIPLSIAAAKGYEELATMLLQHGADVDMEDEFGRRALQDAAEGGHCGLIRLLVENGATIFKRNYIEWEPLQLAVNEEHVEAINLLLDLGADVNCLDDDEWSLLRIASEHDNPEIIRLLLQRGANAARADWEGWSPLHSAVFSACIEIVTLLLDGGADVNTVYVGEFKDENETALDFAIRFGFSDIETLLKQHGGKTYQELHLSNEHDDGNERDKQ